VVADEAEITAHLADGRELPVLQVSALDTRRDLAVLDVGVLDAPPARKPANRLVEEGTEVFVFGMVPTEGHARWVTAKVGGIVVLGSSLTVYRLEGDIPKDASGGPLIGPDGETLGVVTLAETDEGLQTLAVPWKYVTALADRHQPQPISALTVPGRKAPRREVPEHPMSLLEGSSPDGLEATLHALARAIRAGAPAYNEGDISRCYQVYANVAQELISERVDCPGVQVALKEGLQRASQLKDLDHQAWALRDTFDGLLTVIEKFRQSQPDAGSRRPGKPMLLN
jgi:hypothetical protein